MSTPDSTQSRRDLLRYAGLILIGVYLLFALFPIYWTLNTALKPLGLINTVPPTFLPTRITVDSFTWVLTTGLDSIFDSLIVVTGTTILSVILGSLAGYGFSRYGDRVGGENVAFWLLSTRMFPPIAVVLPVFFIWNWLGLRDTHLGLIILYLSFNLPLTTWLMRDFFNKIPRSFEEAAFVDGYGILATFRRVVLPLVAPGLVATTLLAWVFAWNEFLFAFILGAGNVTPYTTILPTLVRGNQVLWNHLMALAFVVTLPPTVMLLAFRNHLIEGMTFGMTEL